MNKKFPFPCTSAYLGTRRKSYDSIYTYASAHVASETLRLYTFAQKRGSQIARKKSLLPHLMRGTLHSF